MNENTRGQRFSSLLVVLVAYAALAVLTTWPLAARLSTHLPDGTDTLSHYWNDWWVWHALRNGQSPYYTRLLFHPDGVSLVYKNFAWLHILPWELLRPLIGGLAAYNVVFILHLAACGFAVFLLVYDLAGSWRAALLAGMIYQCWPYRMSQPSHPNLMSTEWIPLAMLCLGRVLRLGRRRDGVLLGLCLALVGYTRWQLLIPTAIIAGLYLVLSLRRGMGRRQVSSLLLAALTASVALAPPALLLARELRTSPAELVVEGEESTMHTDLLAFLVPASSHPVLGSLTRPVYQRFYPERGSRYAFSPYLGVSVLVLSLLGVRRSSLRQSLPWIAVAALLGLLALGPVLRINGRAYPAVPMPYSLAARLFVVRLLRTPERFNMFIALPAALLSAHGTLYLTSRVSGRGRWNQIALFCLIAAAVLSEYLVLPLPLQSGSVSPFYEQLAAAPDGLAILNIPVDPHGSKPYMFAQTVHGRPILQGRTSRYPQGTFNYLDGQPWLHAMRLRSRIPPKQTDISRQLSALARDGVGYVVVHKTLVGQERWASWRRYLSIIPRYEDEGIAVYATRLADGRDFVLASEVVPGLGPIQSLLSTRCLNPGRAVELDVAWGTSATPGRDYEARLSLTSGDGRTALSSQFPLSEGWPSSAWPTGAVAWGYYVLQVPPEFAPGTYDVGLSLVDARTGEDYGQPAFAEAVHVAGSPCAFPGPEGAIEVNALFGDEMRLLGYQLEQGEGEVVLTLHWRTEHRMDVDYKVFVHVTDPTTGVPVAQDDAMPVQWSYPTTYWSPGELITDAIHISLAEVASGTYSVALGVYDPATSDRLALTDQTGQAPADRRLVLSGAAVEVE